MSVVCELSIICLWAGLSSALHIFCYRTFVGPTVKENYCIIIGSNVRYTESIPYLLFSLVLVGFFSSGCFPRELLGGGRGGEEKITRLKRHNFKNCIA